MANTGLWWKGPECHDDEEEQPRQGHPTMTLPKMGPAKGKWRVNSHGSERGRPWRELEGEWPGTRGLVRPAGSRRLRMPLWHLGTTQKGTTVLASLQTKPKHQPTPLASDLEQSLVHTRYILV